MDIRKAEQIIRNWGGSLSQPHRAYIVLGGQVSWGGGRGVTVNGGFGVDLVWDLWNEQFSAVVFKSISASAGSAIGGGVTAYVGMGFGAFNNVHEAWSGRFYSASLSVAVPGLKLGSFGLSVGATGFTSPDGKMVGAAASASFSASIPLDAPAIAQEQSLSVELGAGDWAPFDALTRMLSNGGPLHSLAGHKILGLEEGIFGVASHMALVVPPISGLYAGLGTYATAVAAYKSYHARR